MQFTDNSAISDNSAAPRWRMIHNDTIVELMGYDPTNNPQSNAKLRSSNKIQIETQRQIKEGSGRIPGRESGEDPETTPRLVSSQQAEDHDKKCGLEKEESRKAQGDSETICAEIQGQVRRENKGLVSTEQGTLLENRPRSESEKVLRNNDGRIQSDAEMPKGKVPDLQTNDNCKDPACGPLPQDGSSEGDSLQQLQLGTRDVQGLPEATLERSGVFREPWPDNCVDMICTSIPFGNQYEYAPSISDCGHNEDNTAFWQQMDFLIPELHRVLKPGRVAAIHVKDRIRFGNVTGLGFPTVEPFSDETVAAFRKHGFHLMGRITIDCDVVRENAQTYRLTWKEMVKDGTKMGCGTCEYVILLRKAQTDTSRGYADTPVTKADERVDGDYSLAQWQIDAAGFWRSSGDRLPPVEVLNNMPLDQVRRLWREYAGNGVYDLAEHEAACQAMLEKGTLPTGWMLFAPVARHPMIWSDIERIRTLNSEQARRAQEQHVCLARNSLVLTLDGWIPIQEVTEDDFVLTHKGNWKKVLVVKNTGIRPVINLRAHGVPNLTITPEHKVWLRKSRSVRQRDGAEQTDPQWIEASESERGYVNLKLPPERDTHLDEQECWLLGRWLADGHVGTRGDFHVSIGPDKVPEFLRMAGKYAGPGRELSATQYRLKGFSASMLKCLRYCGSGASEKQVPVDLLNLPTYKAKALLDGYLSGDGHFLPDRQRWTASSISRALLLGLAMVAQKAYNTIASVYAGRPEGQTTIEGRIVNASQEWILSFDLPHGHRKKQFILEDGAWKKVRSTEEAGAAETWCLKVEDDESFTAEGCIVKNCPLQLDIIERLIRRYSNKGDIVFDPFAGIGSVPYQALRMERRGWGCELNRDYWKTAVGYCERAAANDIVPTLFDLAEYTQDEDADAA